MKKKLPIIILLLLVVAACTPTQDKTTSAAMEIYQQYADHSDKLTVAVISNYKAYGNTFTTVMFHAADNAEWEWVKREFGVFTPSVFLPDSTCDNKKVVVSSLVIDKSELMGLDSNEQEAYIDSVTKTLLEHITGHDHTDTALKLYTIEEGKTDTMQALPEIIRQQERIFKLSRQYKNVGYIISSDPKNRTLWLFFYDSPAQQQLLMKHIYDEK